MPCHLPYIPTTPRSATFCAHIHSTRTDHGSWVLFSARKAHELVLLFGVYYNRFDVRERTRTEIRLSAGSSTVAARNHGGGAPTTTCTTHDELVQCEIPNHRMGMRHPKTTGERETATSSVRRGAPNPPS